MVDSLVIVGSYDPYYLRIVDFIVDLEITARRNVLVLDTTAMSPVPAESYHRGILRIFGLKYPGYDLESRLSQLGATVLDIREILIKAAPQDLSENEQLDLAIATESALLTMLRTDEPNYGKKRVRKLAEKLSQEARNIFDSVNFIFENWNVERTYLWNGRFPSQKMVAIASKSRGIETYHFERGEADGAAYLQPYSIQSRLESQGSVNEVLSGLDEVEITEIADRWLDRRKPSSTSTNEFAANWVESLPKGFLDGSKHIGVVGFYTSSQDEFMSLGPEWKLHNWESQFEAFEALISHFESKGALCYLRVHPNLATKSHEAYRRERKRLRALSMRHPNLIVITHDNPVSSYALLDVSDAVVVWDSTIGLEASARGIPVWTCAASRYGEVADVREVFGADELTAKKMSPWKVDSFGAKKFIAYLVKRDREVDLSRPGWETWDVSRPPRAVALAALLVSGGNPSIRDAIAATVDVWRHRSREFNRASLRAKKRR